MSDAAQSTFVYVTYICTSPERLWEAPTTPESRQLHRPAPAEFGVEGRWRGN